MVRPQLTCSDQGRHKFEKFLKQQTYEHLRIGEGDSIQDIDDGAMTTNKMLPHEFLFLIENAIDR
jgi:hypothetical protein